MTSLRKREGGDNTMMMNFFKMMLRKKTCYIVVQKEKEVGVLFLWTVDHQGPTPKI
jgi:hypothetical protein